MLFDFIYDFLDENCLLSTNQSRFRSDDCNVYLLLALTHNIFIVFYAYPSLVVGGAVQ